MTQQIQETPPPTNGSGDHQMVEVSSLQDYLSILMRGKWVILLAVVIVVGVSVLFTIMTKPVYESTSSVLVDLNERTGSLSFLDLAGANVTNKITNELETLKSRTVAEGVARLLIQRRVLDDAERRPIEIIRVTDSKNEVTRIASIDTILDRLARAVEFIPVKDSDILKITAKSHNPKEAALLANTFMQVYTDRNINTSRLKSRAMREFLQTQLGAKHDQLDTTETALQNYMRKSGVVLLDDEAKKLVDQIAQMEANRDAIEVDISSTQKTLASLKQELATQEPNVARAIGESNDAYIRLIQEQLATLEVQRDVAAAQNSQGSPTQDRVYNDRLSEIDQQITTLKRNLQERTTAFLNSLLPSDSRGVTGATDANGSFLAQVKQRIIEQQIQLDGLNAKKAVLSEVLKEYERQFNLIPQKSIELAKLQRARLSSEKLYLLVEEKFNEAAITETSEFGYLNVIDRAPVPLVPVSPKPLQNIILGFVVGLFLGVGVVLLWARLDNRIRKPEDLKRHGITPLSTIVRMSLNSNGTRSARALPEKSRGFDARIVAFFSPFSPVAEAYRHLRTNVQFARLDTPIRTLIVSSPSPKEGKTTTISNLAVCISQTENRVLLVDADMRRPTLHTVFGLEKEPGLTNVLFERVRFEEVVNRSVIDNLDILPCGAIPPNPAEILGSRRMKEFIEEMKERYDVVLFDTPPLLAVTDTAVLGRLVDGLLLIVSAGSTTLDALLRATESLSGVQQKVLGVVLNNFDLGKAYGGLYGKYRYGYGYGYGYGYAPGLGNGRGKSTKSGQRVG